MRDRHEGSRVTHAAAPAPERGVAAPRAAASAETVARVEGPETARTVAGSRALVRDIMKTKVVRISADDRLSTVEDIMTLGGVRHIPVVQRGELVGVVSERDLLRASLSSLNALGRAHRRAFLQGVEIRRVMSAPPIVIAPDVGVEEAAWVLAERKIGCLPVLDASGTLVGLVTETDVLDHFARLHSVRP